MAAVSGTAAILLLVLSGCAAGGSDDLADRVTDSGYVAGDGSVLEISPAQRAASVAFAGAGENGEQITSADYAGEVLVVNFWYAGCAPCRLEAPDLEATYQQYLPQNVGFLGVNVRDQAATAQEFAATFGVTYPSIIDTDAGVQLSFAGQVAPNAVPTTLVLDRQGRVAARILGRVTEVSILEALIDRVLEEPA
ncbi:TlpA family protein disulfide reductase [Herbiconiux sp. YIM B11900]|uniref:TlpA family protein disulfide reductase n=1 Tax=Herbiconiux sp. YIM B11900 TaxID=3404131 RepID=UPI003F843189